MLASSCSRKLRISAKSNIIASLLLDPVLLSEPMFHKHAKKVSLNLKTTLTGLFYCTVYDGNIQDKTTSNFLRGYVPSRFDFWFSLITLSQIASSLRKLSLVLLLSMS